jgi:hypothetical protein
MKRAVYLTCVLGFALAVSSPVFAGGRHNREAPAASVVSVDESTPSMSPAPETQVNQTKGGVTISVETDLYRTEAVPQAFDTPFQPGFRDIFHIGCTGPVVPGGHREYFIRNYRTEVLTRPDHLVLHLHIVNEMPRVFRGSGALVQFQVAGKTLHVDPAGYGDFLNAIIPPRSSQDIDIVGPPVSELPEQANIGVFLYDVVTKMDEAGNIQEKQNYEWYFTWETQKHTAEVTLPAPEKLCKQY